MFDPVLFAALMGSTALFSPSSLFSAGEQGAWYDPSDFSTMFQNAAGTIPVTAVEQPVGLILDKSGRGNHASQSTAGAAPVLRQEAGGQYYLAFDGTDDSLATGSIDFSATDKMSVFAGVQKLSDATQSFIAHIGDGGANNFLLQNYINERFYWGAGGSSFVQISSPVISSPATRVLTGLSDIAADSLIFRVNGSSSATSSSDQGTGQFSNSTLKVGNDGGTSKYYNGRLYSLIVRGALSTDAQIASTETWVNRKTGAY